jgi:hypothetical protein
MIECDIREVPQEAFEAAAKDFIKLMSAFKPSTDGAFAARAASAANIADEYKTAGKKYIATALRGGEVFGLVGLMILSTKESDAYVKVEDICTHPLTSGAGLLMIEYAIEVSKGLGKGGTLRLFDASGGSFYDDLGFQVVDGQTKQLVGGIKARA